MELPKEISLRADRTTSLDLESYIREASFPIGELVWEITSTGAFKRLFATA